MRIQVGLVHARQLTESRAVGVEQPGPLQGVAVALALEEPAQRILGRRDGQAEQRQHQHEQRQRRRVVKRGVTKGSSTVPQDLIHQPQPGDRQDHTDDDQLGQMAMNMMADLMRENDLDLFGRELVQERIAQQHAARAA